MSDDIRADLSAAVEAVEKPAETPPAPPAEAPPAETPPSGPEGAKVTTAPIGGEEQQGEKARDPKTGQFTKAGEKPPEKAPPAPVEAPKAAPPAGKPTEQPKAPAFATEGARAPQSWRPAAREKFAGLPQEVQEEAIRLDREVRRTMQDSAEARQSHQKYREIFAPAEPFLRSMNIDQHQFTADAIQTAMSLASGPPEVKAQTIVRLMQIYGVDVPTLDRVLTGVLTNGQAPMQPQAPQYRDPRVDEMYRLINEARSQRDATLEEQARQGLATIENEEFFEDLREDMADLLDLAAKRNLALTPQEAYHRAAMMHPEISRVLQQREAAKAALNPNGSTQRAREAAVSVRGTAEVPAPPAQPQNRRDEIAAAWDAAEAKSR